MYFIVTYDDLQPYAPPESDDGLGASEFTVGRDDVAGRKTVTDGSADAGAGRTVPMR